MEIKNITLKKGAKKIRKILKISLIIIFSILLISIVSHFVWKSSGSNEWELVKENNGIKVWVRKTPGHTLLQFRAQMKVKSKLSSAVFFVTDDATGSDVGGYDEKIYKKIDSPEWFCSLSSYKIDFPFPIGTMESVLLLYYVQDSVTKAVKVDVLAAPNAIPPTPNVWRLRHMHDIWILTPLPNGEVEMEVMMDINSGVPYYILNIVMVKNLEEVFGSIRELLKEDRYKNAEHKRPYIKELNDGL